VFQFIDDTPFTNLFTYTICIHVYVCYCLFQSCCYNQTTLHLIEEKPLAGHLYFSHPKYNNTKHTIHDVNAKESCCVQSNFCHLFYELHPVGTCYTRSPYNFGKW